MDLSPCADLVRQYLTQLRQETGIRLLEVVYKDNTRVPSKWWIMWNKRKFLNRAL
jgi:actin related protein 2/3 complex subunit 3